MKTHLAFLLSTAGTGLLAFNVAHAAPAAPQAIQEPQSYDDLLAPVENPGELLIQDDLARANQPRPLLNLVQWHHHHHHHHHHGFFPGFGVRIAPPAYDEPECYVRRQVYTNRWGERVIRRVRVCD